MCTVTDSLMKCVLHKLPINTYGGTCWCWYFRMSTLESRHSCIHKIFVCNVARVSFSIIWIVNFISGKFLLKLRGSPFIRYTYWWKFWKVWCIFLKYSFEMCEKQWQQAMSLVCFENSIFKSSDSCEFWKIFHSKIATCTIFVTFSAKTVPFSTFGVSRNTILKHWSHCSSLVPCFIHARFTV